MAQRSQQWRQPKDHSHKSGHDAMLRTIALQERWSAANRRQRDTISRLVQGDEGVRVMVAETIAARKLAYDTLRESGLTHEQAEEAVEAALAVAAEVAS